MGARSQLHGDGRISLQGPRAGGTFWRLTGAARMVIGVETGTGTRSGPRCCSTRATAGAGVRVPPLAKGSWTLGTCPYSPPASTETAPSPARTLASPRSGSAPTSRGAATMAALAPVLEGRAAVVVVVVEETAPAPRRPFPGAWASTAARQSTRGEGSVAEPIWGASKRAAQTTRRRLRRPGNDGSTGGAVREGGWIHLIWLIMVSSLLSNFKE